MSSTHEVSSVSDANFRADSIFSEDEKLDFSIEHELWEELNSFRLEGDPNEEGYAERMEQRNQKLIHQCKVERDMLRYKREQNQLTAKQRKELELKRRMYEAAKTQAKQEAQAEFEKKSQEISAIFSRELMHYKNQLGNIKEQQFKDLSTIKMQEKKIIGLEKIIVDSRTEGAPPHQPNVRRVSKVVEISHEDFLADIRQQLMHLSDQDVNDLIADKELGKRIGPKYSELQRWNEQLKRDVQASQMMNWLHERTETELRADIEKLQLDIKENWRFFERKEEMLAQQEKERYDKLQQEKELLKDKLAETQLFLKEELRLKDAIIVKQESNASKMQQEMKYLKSLLFSPRMLEKYKQQEENRPTENIKGIISDFA